MGCGCKGTRRSAATVAAANLTPGPTSVPAQAPGVPADFQYVVRCADGGSQVFLSAADAARVAADLGCLPPVAQPIIGGMIIPR